MAVITDEIYKIKNIIPTKKVIGYMIDSPDYYLWENVLNNFDTKILNTYKHADNTEIILIRFAIPNAQLNAFFNDLEAKTKNLFLLGRNHLINHAYKALDDLFRISEQETLKDFTVTDHRKYLPSN